MVYIGFSVQVQIRERSRKKKWIECSSHCDVFCTVLFKMFALVCIMDCSHLWHGGAYWNHQFKFRLEREARRRNGWRVQVIVLWCALLDQDHGIGMHNGCSRLLHGGAHWIVQWFIHIWIVCSYCMEVYI